MLNLASLHFYRFFRPRIVRITAPAATNAAAAVKPASSVRRPGVSPGFANGSVCSRSSGASVGVGAGVGVAKDAEGT